jgi:hypothetical protein
MYLVLDSQVKSFELVGSVSSEWFLIYSPFPSLHSNIVFIMRVFCNSVYRYVFN